MSKIKVSIDEKLIEKTAIDGADRFASLLLNTAKAQSEEILRETERFHPHRSDTLISNLEIQKEILDNIPRYRFVDKAEHAYMQEFGAPPHTVIVDEKMSEYYGWEIGTQKRVYYVEHSAYHDITTKLHQISYTSAQPFLAPGMLRAINILKKKRKI